jgi:hypothetical protein
MCILCAMGLFLSPSLYNFYSLLRSLARSLFHNPYAIGLYYLAHSLTHSLTHSPSIPPLSLSLSLSLSGPYLRTSRMTVILRLFPTRAFCDPRTHTHIQTSTRFHSLFRSLARSLTHPLFLPDQHSRPSSTAPPSWASMTFLPAPQPTSPPSHWQAFFSFDPCQLYRDLN